MWVDIHWETMPPHHPMNTGRNRDEVSTPHLLKQTNKQSQGKNYLFDNRCSWSTNIRDHKLGISEKNQMDNFIWKLFHEACPEIGKSLVNTTFQKENESLVLVNAASWDSFLLLVHDGASHWEISQPETQLISVKYKLGTQHIRWALGSC